MLEHPHPEPLCWMVKAAPCRAHRWSARAEIASDLSSPMRAYNSKTCSSMRQTTESPASDCSREHLREGAQVDHQRLSVERMERLRRARATALQKRPAAARPRGLPSTSGSVSTVATILLRLPPFSRVGMRYCAGARTRRPAWLPSQRHSRRMKRSDTSPACSTSPRRGISKISSGYRQTPSAAPPGSGTDYRLADRWNRHPPQFRVPQHRLDRCRARTSRSACRIRYRR